MTATLKGKKVAVLLGGPGPEREVSLRSGAAVARALRSLGAVVQEIDVKDSRLSLPESIDLAYNMIHGTFGEDGQIQEILERQGIPYTGEGVAGSQLAFDKILSKRAFDEHGVPTGQWHVIAAGEKPRFEVPFVVKSPRQGSSVGVHIIKNPADLDPALEDCFRFGEVVIVEEFFSGRELTVGILGDVALPVIEIVPREGFYDYQHKYTKGASEVLCPRSDRRRGHSSCPICSSGSEARSRPRNLFARRCDSCFGWPPERIRDQYHSGHDGNQSAAEGRRGGGTRFCNALRTDRPTFHATHSPLNG